MPNGERVYLLSSHSWSWYTTTFCKRPFGILRNSDACFTLAIGFLVDMCMECQYRLRTLWMSMKWITCFSSTISSSTDSRGGPDSSRPFSYYTDLFRMTSWIQCILALISETPTVPRKTLSTKCFSAKSINTIGNDLMKSIERETLLIVEVWQSAMLFKRKRKIE